MTVLKKTVSAAALAGIMALGSFGAANAVSVDVSTLVADHGNGGGVFIATENGDLDNPAIIEQGAIQFGPVTYNGSLNPNGQALSTVDRATAQASAPTSNGFTNGFTFNSPAGVPGFGFTVQPNEAFPNSGVGAGFLDLRITFLDVGSITSSDEGIFAPTGSPLVGFTQAQLDTATLIGETQLTNITDGTITFTGADLPFFEEVAFDTEILALISGTAFSENPQVFPNYIVNVQTVPLPAPVVLLISALLGLGFLGRRKAKANV